MANRTLDTLYGTLNLPDWPDDLIIRSLEQLGEWCAAESAVAGALLEPGETLWDAGAFLGTFALGTAMVNTPGKVVAIEANPAIADALTQNLTLLPCPAQLVSAGLAQRSGWLVTEGEDPQNHGATRYHFQQQTAYSGTAIQCRTLADLRAEHGAYHMLKLDLEGMELDAIKGDLPFLKEHQPVIWAECNEAQASLTLLGGLKWLQYEVLYIAFPAFRKDNFRRTDDLIYPMAYEAALVAGPIERMERFEKKVATLLPNENILYRRITSSHELRAAMFDTPRWARPEWQGLSRVELMARLGRAESGTTFKQFLNDS